ncbi:MAG: cytochrome c oxidase subunit [Acidimicrobiaceae bacterium]|nr:cytochrome c oxidase subunit [Acidimicrobiaceae bacterium]
MTSRRAFWVVAAPLTAATAVACSKRSPSIVDPHGPEARRIADIWWLMFVLAAGVYVIVAGFIIFAVVRGRRSESGKPSRVSDNTFIWWGGIIVPVAILAVLAVETVSAVSAVRKPESSPLRVEVVGKRWWWDVRYPDDGVVTANEIHVPTGRQIEIGLDSDNVIHSFWVPQLAGKLDLIPGQHNILRLTADTPGTYRGQCAEYCGLEHGRMVFLVIADPPDVFARWVTRNQRTPSPPEDEAAARGQLVFTREACAGCHTVKGTQATGTYGPDLTTFGSRTSIGSVTVPNTPGNLAGWIADSQSIKPGNLMPPIALSSNDLNDIVAYLESLK